MNDITLDSTSSSGQSATTRLSPIVAHRFKLSMPILCSNNVVGPVGCLGAVEREVGEGNTFCAAHRC